MDKPNLKKHQDLRWGRTNWAFFDDVIDYKNYVPHPIKNAVQRHTAIIINQNFRNSRVASILVYSNMLREFFHLLICINIFGLLS